MDFIKLLSIKHLLNNRIQTLEILLASFLSFSIGFQTFFFIEIVMLRDIDTPG